MATLTITTCDRCKADDYTNPNIQFWKIGIAVGHHGTYSSSPNMVKETEKLWCKKCMLENGIIFSEAERSKELDNPSKAPTFEDILKEFIIEIIEENK